MKELSIEEKAKAYDEAIERAKVFKEHLLEIDEKDYADEMDYIFPELKESEDERIRRWIINYLDNKALNSGIIQEKTNIKNAITWLEKQGKGINGNNREIPNSEQKPADKVESKFKVGDTIQPKDPVLGEPRIIERIYPTWGYGTNKGILDFEFEDNWELVEQKSAWSEEDEARFKSCIKILQPSDGYDTINTKWLKSLKDKVQPKQEWSEEDEDILNTIINHFEIDLECTENDDIIRWLKFLKDRVLPQNTWKPSDEQMADLWNMVCECRPADQQLLQDIYYGIKKLRGE